MSFDTVEQSAQGAQPVEVYDFTTPTGVTRVTTAHKDVNYASNVYTAAPGSRSSLITGDLASNPSDVVVSLPAGHPIAQAYANGVPMRELRVTIRRFYPAYGVALQFWDGYVSNISFRDRLASFRVPSGTADALSARVPSVLCSRLCSHVLYDDYCTISRGANSAGGTPLAKPTTITGISADGLTLTIADIMLDLTFFEHGEAVHAASTERRTITSTPSGFSVILQCPYPNGSIAIGNPITLYAGCDHTVGTCHAKFTNVANFSGIPWLPRSNIFYVGLNAALYGST